MSEALRLAYISPLPPVRSGISDYSVDLLACLPESLQAGSELQVVRVPGQEVDRELLARYRPIEVAELDARIESGASWMPWYQMGNNLYHAEIGRLARLRPGVLTLHDIWLHHLLIEQTLAQGDVGRYVERLTEEHGWIGGAVALPPRWSGYSQAAVFALPAHRTLLEAQRGILVHSRWAADLLSEEGIGTSVAVVPMPMPAPPATPELRERAAGMRGRLGVPEAALLLGSFGFQTPIKRTASVVRALAERGLEEAHLLVAGEVSPAVDLSRVARECGVAGRVHAIGFLDEEEFQVAIEACDLCVNLRYPTAGETSASLLRTFARGRAAVVSDYAQFADFEGSVVVRVPVAEPEVEAEALAAALSPLVRDRERVAAMGRNAHELVVREHDPASAARAMLDAIRDFAEADRGGSEPRPASCPRPTSRTWGELPSAVEVSGLDDWQVGERREVEIELFNRGFATLLPAEDGPGGVALAVGLFANDTDLRADSPWLPLPRRLEPGESSVFRVRLRRPPGTARLRVEPQILGGEGFGALGGGCWEKVL